jgi:hypothetical protein
MQPAASSTGLCRTDGRRLIFQNHSARAARSRIADAAAMGVPSGNFPEAIIMPEPLPSDDDAVPEAVPSDDAIRLRQAEAELARLRGIVRNQEHALRVAGKVLAPYAARAGIGR